ncbi:MAG TPA: hypothetical protein VFP82_03745 [Chthoniobacterales bacterium]|nr:hypothetical protein [Chthoniobacterales bacterium]
MTGCEWFGPAEKYKTDEGRTTYRSADENSATSDEVRPIAQKIPGESKKASSDRP